MSRCPLDVKIHAMEIPQSVRSALWSYDVSALDLQKDYVLIITNVLNLGTEEAVRWLFATYDKKDIETVLSTPKPGLWDKRSLNLWSVVFDTPAHQGTRF